MKRFHSLYFAVHTFTVDPFGNVDIQCQNMYAHWCVIIGTADSLHLFILPSSGSALVKQQLPSLLPEAAVPTVPLSVSSLMLALFFENLVWLHLFHPPLPSLSELFQVSCYSINKVHLVVWRVSLEPCSVTAAQARPSHSWHAFNVLNSHFC